jgi:hypothetical protein
LNLLAAGTTMGDTTTTALTLCPAAEALAFKAMPTNTVAHPLDLQSRPGTCIVIAKEGRSPLCDARRAKGVGIL